MLVVNSLKCNNHMVIFNYIVGEKMKKIIMGAALAASLLSTQVIADTGVYVGADFQAVKYDTGISNLTGTAKLDEKDSGYKLLVGYNFTKNFGVEAHYADFGEASISGNAGDRFTIDGTTLQFNQTGKITVGAKSIGLAAVGRTELGSDFGAFIKAGLHKAELEYGVAAATASASSTDSKTKVFGAIGIDYAITPQFLVSTELNMYKFEDGDLTGVSLGLRYKF